MPNRSPGPIDVALGHRIRARRREVRLSQTALGELIGVSFQQVQKYEGGSNRLSYGKLVQIADALKASVESLTGGIARKGADKPTPFDALLADGQAVRLGMAFMKIKDRAMRKILVRLVNQLAESRGRR